MSNRPSKRSRRAAHGPSRRPGRPSGARLLADHLDDALSWDEVLHAIEFWPGIYEEIVRAVRVRHTDGTLPEADAERLIEAIVEHEAFRISERGPVIKTLTARINAIERAHGLSPDESWLVYEGPLEWQLLNRAWEAYLDAVMIRLLEALGENELAEFVALRGAYPDDSPHDDELIDRLLTLDGDGANVPPESGDPPEETAAHAESAEVRVIAAVISRGDELLVCQRPLHKRHGGLWEFPGGKAEPDETDETSARRELAEELGVQVVRADAPDLEVHDEGSSFLIAFVPVAIEGEPECREHKALRWGVPEELATLPLAPADRRYVERVIARRAAAR